MQIIAEYGNLIAAALSALAAIFAAAATYRAPIAAAEHAEILRRDGTEAQQRRQVKLNVFGQIMQERADISQRDCVVALNLIDVAFSDSLEVREAWAELFESLKSDIPEHVRNERLRKLLRAMAHDLGLSDKLRLDDFDRVYYPHYMAREAQVKILEQQRMFRHLTQQQHEANSTSNGNIPTDKPMDGWPPRPST